MALEIDILFCHLYKKYMYCEICFLASKPHTMLNGRKKGFGSGNYI